MRRLLELAERRAVDLDAVGVAEALWLALHLDPRSRGGEKTEDAQKPAGVAGTVGLEGPLTGDGSKTIDADYERDNKAVTADAASSPIASAVAPGTVRGGLEVRMPGGPALPGGSAIQSTLRPFKRRARSLHETVLDEIATVERYAETRVLAPVLRPARERWLDVALVVDEHESMAVWREAIEDLVGVLVRLGAFRDVRIWGLSSDPAGVSITRRTNKGSSYGGERRLPNELIDPTGRRLVLVVSDCVSPGWRNGAFAREALMRWARSGPTALVQVLPQRFWLRTGLGRGRQVRLSSNRAGVPNSLLTESVQAGRFSLPRSVENGTTSLLLPVLTLDEVSVAAWASLVVGEGQAQGWRLPVVESFADAAEAPDRRTADDRVNDFLRGATPTAKRLASFLAAAPLQLPVMRLVQRVMLPDSRQSHLAEILLGGLLHRVSPPQVPLDEGEYEFYDGVRNRLLHRCLRHETLRVIEEVSGWLERQQGIRTGFRAALVDEVERLGEGDLPFARLTAEVLRRLGGEWGGVAARIEAAAEWDDLGRSGPSPAPIAESKSSEDVPFDLAREGYPERERPDPSTVPLEFEEEVERSAREGRAGDLGLLAEEIEGCPWEREGLRAVGRQLLRLRAYDDARITWERLRGLTDADVEADMRLATAYQRLGDLVRSDQAIERALAAPGLDSLSRAELLALRGSNDKRRWREDWADAPDGERRQRALESPYLHAARTAYFEAYQEDLGHYYPALNALALARIEVELARAEPETWLAGWPSEEEARKAEGEIEELSDKLVTGIELAFASAHRRGRADPWLAISEADAALLSGKAPGWVAKSYRQALARASPFDLDAVGQQLALYRELGILGPRVEAAEAAVAEAHSRLEPVAEPPPRPARVLVFSGHRIDAPGRPTPRFPAAAEAEARRMIAAAVAEERRGADGPVVGLAGGASGGDILFHEVCGEQGIATTLYLAAPRGDYVAASVADAGSDWVARFDRLHERLPTRVLGERLRVPGWLAAKPGFSVWQRNNLWLLHNALVQEPSRVSLLALWNGEAGDGPGGTAYMVDEVKKRGGRVVVLDAKTLVG